MKLLLALAAMMFAITAVAAEASAPCAAGAELSASWGANSPAGAPPCHDPSAQDENGTSVGCELAAFCALLCGVVAPGGPESARAQAFLAISFPATVVPLAGVLRRPEAPPPRMRVL